MSAPGLRARKKARVRDQLAAAAMKLFVDRGFEQTTVEQIVAEVDISLRTFFRYFASKEAVVLMYHAQIAADFAAELAARPADEPPVRAARTAFRTLMRRFDPKRLRRLMQLLMNSPATDAQRDAKRTTIETVLALDIAQRLGVDPQHDLRPRLLARILHGAFDVATRAWLDGGARGALHTEVDAAVQLATSGWE